MITVTKNFYRCEKCNVEYETFSQAMYCESEHELKQRIIDHSIDRVGVLSRDETIFCARSLIDLTNHLDFLTDGIIDDISFNDYNYPCFVIIKEYDEIDVFRENECKCGSDNNGLISFVHVRLMSEYLNDIGNICDEIVNNLK